MRIPPIIEKELEALTVPYRIDQWAAHRKIFVNNKFCGIIPMKSGNSSSRRAELNVRSQIRRAVRGG